MSYLHHALAFPIESFSLIFDYIKLSFSFYKVVLHKAMNVFDPLSLFTQSLHLQSSPSCIGNFAGLCEKGQAHIAL